MALRISPEEFCRQWAPGGNARVLPSRLEFNTHDFVTAAGAYTLSRFRTSFIEGAFYGSGRRWPERKSRWGLRFTHPVLRDTGTLAASLRGEAERRDRTNITQKAAPGRRAIFRRGARYAIWTTASNPRQQGRRGASRSYAAVHNTDPALSPYTVNQYSRRKPEHRQFMGLNPRIDAVVNALYVPLIFKGFPGT